MLHIQETTAAEDAEYQVDVCVRFLFARQFWNPVYERDSEHTDVIPVDSGRFRSVNLSKRIRTKITPAHPHPHRHQTCNNIGGLGMVS